MGGHVRAVTLALPNVTHERDQHAQEGSTMTDIFAVYPNSHYLHANDEGYDLAFIEAEHYERNASCQPGNPAQFPLGGKSVVEHYASTDVPVLALPILYCLTCGTDQPCAYTHTLQPDMGACKIEWVKDPQRYVKSERVHLVAERTYTGQVQRKG